MVKASCFAGPFEVVVVFFLGGTMSMNTFDSVERWKNAVRMAIKRHA